MDLYEIYSNKDREGLHKWINVHFGINIPKVAVCTDLGHCSPFDALADCFMNSRTDFMIIGARGTGKTLDFAILDGLYVLAFDSCEVLSTGAVEEQVEKCFRYFTDILKLPVFASIYDPRFAARHEVELLNRSRANIVPGTVAQMNGPHPQKLLIDELELFKADALQEARFIPKGAKGIPSQMIKTTSRKYAFGLAEAELKSISDGQSETQLRVWCIFDALEKCKMPSCGPCKRRVRSDGKSFYDICVLNRGVETGPNSNGEDEMRAKKADGHYDLEELWKTFIDIQTSPEAFDSQMLSRAPSKEGLIYPMLNAAVHLKDPEWFEEQMRFKVLRPWHLTLSVDHGFRDPTVVLFGIEDGEFIYVLDELYKSGRLPQDTVAEANMLMRQMGWVEGETYADPSRPDNLEIWRNAGFNVHPANNSIDLGIQECQNAFRYIPATDDSPGGTPPRIYISKKCKNTWRDLLEYHWRIAKPEELSENARRTPEPRQSDHGCDAIRYLVMAFYGMSSGATIIPKGNPYNINEDSFSWDEGFSNNNEW